MRDLFFAFGTFGTQELLIVGALIMVLFGGAKIPELMRGIGSGVREFKNAVGGESGDKHDGGDSSGTDSK